MHAQSAPWQSSVHEPLKQAPVHVEPAAHVIAHDAFVQLIAQLIPAGHSASQPFLHAMEQSFARQSVTQLLPLLHVAAHALAVHAPPPSLRPPSPPSAAATSGPTDQS